MKFDPRIQDAIDIYDARVAADPSAVERWEKVQDLLQMMLNPRWELVRHTYKSFDAFSQGYVYGCVNMMMEAFHLDRSAPEALATQVIVFGGVFGMNPGAQYLRRCLDDLSANAELRRGALSGQEDALALLEHGKCADHWVRYANGLP